VQDQAGGAPQAPDTPPTPPAGEPAPAAAPPVPERFDSPWARLTRSQERRYVVAREVLAGAGVVLLVLGLLWGTTGQPLGRSPIVVVESGSMMHCRQAPGTAPLGRMCTTGNLGRLGTIDPGDLILVKDIDRPSDVGTLAGGGKSHYGKAGDVVVYRPDGNAGRTPVIHRALFWLQVNDDGTFSIDDLGLSHVANLDQESVRALGLMPGYADTLRDPRFDSLCGPVGPARSGFITRGDNNPAADQSAHGGIAACPVKLDFILGKARGEIPWLGLFKLLVSDVTTGSQNYHNASKDTKWFLWITLAVLVGGPYAYEKWKHRRSGPAA
jgi:signal peptidase